MKKIQTKASMGRDGKTTAQAALASAALAEFITRGQAAQKAVDEIIAAAQCEPKP